MRQRRGHGHSRAGPAGVPAREAAGAGRGGGAAPQAPGAVRAAASPAGRGQAGTAPTPSSCASPRALLPKTQAGNHLLLWEVFDWEQGRTLIT